MVRPKKPAKERRTELLQVRVSKSEKIAFEQAAKKQGCSVGELVRQHPAIAL